MDNEYRVTYESCGKTDTHIEVISGDFELINYLTTLMTNEHIRCIIIERRACCGYEMFKHNWIKMENVIEREGRK